jgi:hypothetical protein
MRTKREQRGKPLSPDKWNSIVEKLFEGLEGQVIAKLVNVSNSTVSKVKNSMPLFFDCRWGNEEHFDD